MKAIETIIDDRQDAVSIPDSYQATAERIVARALESYSGGEGPFEVSISLVSDEEIHALNREYRGIDQPTDVLSFAMRDSGDEDLIFEDEGTAGDEGYAEILGDIVISAATALSQSEEYGHSLDRELGFLTVHGMLHLLGFDHVEEEKAKVMRAAEEQLLEGLGLTRTAL